MNDEGKKCNLLEPTLYIVKQTDMNVEKKIQYKMLPLERDDKRKNFFLYNFMGSWLQFT